jgi:chromosomal replication initiation ATPase DnaA
MFIEHYEKLIPILFKKAVLEDFHQSHPLLLIFAKDWIKKPIPLFVHGEYGVGKTHFVYALMRELINAPIYGLYFIVVQPWMVFFWKP